jgi:hypothetical protein
VLDGRLQLPADAAASAAGSTSTMSSRAGTPEQQQQQPGLTPAEYHELQLAASAADKHPVTWRSMREKVWCEVRDCSAAAAIEPAIKKMSRQTARNAGCCLV